MIFLIDAFQAIQSDVRIDLSRRNIGVAEDCLHGAQISAVLYHVRGATVAQHMRTNVPAGALSRCADHLPDTLARQLATPSADKEQRRCPSLG